MKQGRTLDRAQARKLLDEEVTSIERFHSAGVSDVFEVTTTEGRVVVKLFPEDDEWKLAKEVFIYRLLAEHGVDLPVPRVVAVDEQEHAVVLERIEGSPTSDRVADADASVLYRDLGRLLARLHSIELDEFGYVVADGIVDRHATNLDYMRFQFGKRLTAFADLGGGEALAGAIAEHVREREELLVGPAVPVLCHNDAHEGNLVVTTAGDIAIAGLFDFENALAGDPLLDLAKSVAYSARDRAVITDALADGYGELPPHWREAIDLYGVYHVLELWWWFASNGESEHLDALTRSLEDRIG
jgi:aminoglycoside phosphotransferase (APT) family kinase protein